jgi:hypothetical protein
MMNQELQQGPTYQELELPEACIGCGGPLAARFTADHAAGVCLACRRIAALSVSRAAGGINVVQLPGGEA